MTRSAIRKQHIRPAVHHIHPATIRLFEGAVKAAIREAIETRPTDRRPYRFRVEIKDQGDGVPESRRFLACLMDNYADPMTGAALVKSAFGKTEQIARTELWSKLHADMWMDPREKAMALEAVREIGKTLVTK